MLYHLNLRFDPSKDECQNGHFVDWNADQDIHKRSKQWVKRGVNGAWQKDGEEDTQAIVLKTGDEVVVAIGTPSNEDITVENVTLLIGKDEEKHEKIPGNPFEGMPNNSVVLAGKPSIEPRSHDTRWTEFSLGRIQAKPRDYASQKRHYRFMVSANLKHKTDNKNVLYAAAHDPVMEVDDGPRG